MVDIAIDLKLYYGAFKLRIMRWATARNLKKDESGFTLSELLVSILVIGILAIIAIPVYGQYSEQTKQAVVDETAANAERLASLALTEFGPGESLNNSINSLDRPDVAVRFIGPDGGEVTLPTSDFCVQAYWRDSAAEGSKLLSSIRGDGCEGLPGDVGGIGGPNPDSEEPAEEPAEEVVPPKTDEELDAERGTITTIVLRCDANISSYSPAFVGGSVAYSLHERVGDTYLPEPVKSSTQKSSSVRINGIGPLEAGKEYELRIDGTFDGIRFDPALNSAEAQGCFRGVTHWGNSGVTSLQGAFSKARNVELVDDPPLTVTNMSSMFSYNGANSSTAPFDASIIKSDFSEWDTKNVVNMSNMFANTRNLSVDISNWDLSSVINMDEMFRGARDIVSDITQLDVSNVETMRSMFKSSNFNQPIGGWETDSLRDITEIFSTNLSFNQPIENWNVDQVTQMAGAFSSANNFNQPLNGWKVDNVTNMNSMFQGNGLYGTARFNQPLDRWNVSNVTDMQRMFSGAHSFNQPLGNWDISKVTSINSMFENASAMRQDLRSWAEKASTGLTRSNWRLYSMLRSQDVPTGW